MQGMNFNYDSTYIQNTIQENPKTEAFDLSDKADSTVNFMQMIHSAKTEMSEPVKDFNSESVNSKVFIFFFHIKFRHLDGILF
mgnify:CR=1 FL=1